MSYIRSPLHSIYVLSFHWFLRTKHKVVPLSTSTNLLDLPMKIFNLVFQLLLQVDYRALCLVCKVLCKLAEQWLYSRLRWFKLIDLAFSSQNAWRYLNLLKRLQLDLILTETSLRSLTGPFSQLSFSFHLDELLNSSYIKNTFFQLVRSVSTNVKAACECHELEIQTRWGTLQRQNLYSSSA